jgi:TolB-like protein
MDGGKVRIAVMPFQKASQDDTANRLLFYDSGMGSQDEASTVESMVAAGFMDRLSRNEKIDVIPVADTHKLYRRITSEAVSGETSSKTEQERILRIGKELQADVIAVGYIYRFRERDGTPLAVQKPASVACEIRLLDGKTGTPIWRGAFDKTQRSLMENLFHLPTFIRGKGQWITAKELADEGMEELFQSFPAVR